MKMKKLVEIDSKKFYEINELVVRTTPMRTHYHSKNILERWVWQRKKKIIINLLDNLSYNSIIDVGCADGGLFELVKENCDYTGVDISPTQIAYFKRILKENKITNKAELIKADARKMPFKNRKFDVALACDVLEHLLDPIKSMREIKRVVKNGGYVIFSIPNESLFQLVRLLTGRFPLRSPDHLYSITVEDIKQHFPKIIKQFGIPLNLSPNLNLINILLVKNEHRR